MCVGVRDWGGKLLRRPVQTRYNMHVYTVIVHVSHPLHCT